MKITRSTKERPLFADIKIGEWFIDADGDIAIKLSLSSTTDNCVFFNVSGGHLINMDTEDYAYPVEVELIVTDKQ